MSHAFTIFTDERLSTFVFSIKTFSQSTCLCLSHLTAVYEMSFPITTTNDLHCNSTMLCLLCLILIWNQSWPHSSGLHLIALLKKMIFPTRLVAQRNFRDLLLHYVTFTAQCSPRFTSNDGNLESVVWRNSSFMEQFKIFQCLEPMSLAFLLSETTCSCKWAKFWNLLNNICSVLC